MTNKTGSPSIKGTIIQPSTVADNAFKIPVVPFACTGVVYDNGVPDGSLCKIVIHGKAYVRTEDNIAIKRDWWVGASTVTAGTVLATTEPPGTGFVLVSQDHFREVGHTLTERSAGSTALILCQLHWL